MKKIKLSLTEKKLLRTLLAFVLVQILIVIAFVRLFGGSQPVALHDTKQIDIIVEDIFAANVLKKNVLKKDLLVISADSEKYVLSNHSRREKYSVNELYKNISEGDSLTLICYEDYNIFGRVNIVVGARNETEIYRSIEEYNRSKEGVPAFVAVMFFVIELIFIGIVIVCVWLNQNTIKSLCRKTKKLIKNK